jgi:hypothetical protein
MKMAVFWVVAPCSLVDVYRLHGATTQKTAIFVLTSNPTDLTLPNPTHRGSPLLPGTCVSKANPDHTRSTGKPHCRRHFVPRPTRASPQSSGRAPFLATLQQHKVHSKFHPNTSSGTGFQSCRQTNMQQTVRQCHCFISHKRDSYSLLRPGHICACYPRSLLRLRVFLH